MDGVSGFIRAMGYARLAAIAGVTGVVAAVLIFLMMRAGSPQMALLYSDLDLVDAAQIVEELDSSRTTYRQTRDGTAIFVPESDVFSLRMQFASEGVPARGIVGYEIFDNQNALGTTAFVQNVNHVRALEGELSRTISSLATIRTARVHLVLAERVRFSRDSTEPSASITVSPRSGTLTQSQVQAIQHLVASAVEGLAPARVAIVDQYGNLLASGMGDTNGGFAGASDERLVGYETRLRERIEDIVSRIVGPGNARVEVTAEMDFNRTVTESEIYDPEGQVTLSSSTIETSAENADGTSTGGVVSIGADLPESAETTASESGGASSNDTSFEETTNYQNSRTVRTEVQEGGRLVRLNVAVVVDGIQTEGAGGNVTYTPRSEDEMARIEALVRTTMGFDEGRGDLIEVVNLQFTRNAEDIPEIEEPGLLDLDRIGLVRIAEVFIFGLIALLTIFFVFRPIMKRLLAAPDPQALAIAAAGAGGQMAIAQGAVAQLPAPGGGSAVSLPPTAADVAAFLPPGTTQADISPVQSAASAAIDIAQVQGQVKESSVKKVGEIVAQHPDESVAILRTWLHESG